MCLTIVLFVLVSLGLGLIEIGLIVQPLLNIGFGYLAARQRNCGFRWADAMQIIMASGTVLVITVTITLASATTLGLFIGLINAVISVIYIPYKVFSIFPKGGRNENPSLVEDLKNIIDEKKKSL
ncbi:MAG: hypothetical protein L6Q49_04640 [Anaerolineales bacterium]|nr:hypothetical protein [Anaerolineales bacterium]